MPLSSLQMMFSDYSFVFCNQFLLRFAQNNKHCFSDFYLKNRFDIAPTVKNLKKGVLFPITRKIHIRAITKVSRQASAQCIRKRVVSERIHIIQQTFTPSAASKQVALQPLIIVTAKTAGGAKALLYNTLAPCIRGGFCQYVVRLYVHVRTRTVRLTMLCTRS